MSIWSTAGLHEALEAKINDGRTAAQAARELSAEFKFPISRLAVIGRVSRTPGLYLKTLPSKMKPKKPRAPRKPRAVKVKIMRSIEGLAAPTPLGEVDGGCKFPMWGDKIDRSLFCGNAKHALTPYCKFHEALVWRPAKSGEPAAKNHHQQRVFRAA